MDRKTGPESGDAKRQKDGKFGPGNKANPGGRPKIVEELRARALRAVEDHVLHAWVAEVEGQGPNWVKCSELLAAYGMGKPVQAMEHTGKDGAPIQTEVRADVHIYIPDNGRNDGPVKP